MSAVAEMNAGVACEAGTRRSKIRVGFIVGPTGSGKSALAIDIAERLGA